MSFALETLEFGKLLELVAQNAQTPMGAARLAALCPKTNRIELESDLAAISETICLNEERQVAWSFSGLENPSDTIAILKIENAALEPGSLLEIAAVCYQAIFARSSIQPEKESSPTIWSVVENIPPTLLASIERINKKVLPSGEIDDSASPQLAKIRREINSQRSRLTKSLESIMRSSGDAIQDELVTVRNDRFVIPVKADFRGKVGGVAHGFSSSGQTVFIEPLEAIEANNELQNLKGKEEREVARILFSLTEELRGQLPAVEAAVEAVTALDVIKTKVEFARKFNAVVPGISDDGTLEFMDARHPLLEERITRSNESDGIVPSSFALTGDRSVMIISGANAGGKTVVLKTAGLLSLMAVSGLPVPAKSAQVPFYESILADIGDHQSLAANLSTFSSHMSNIAGMMRECVAPSLVLLDEAGTGTDPEEGSALGVAIVDHFRRNCDAQVIASTHYRGLKTYAANDENVINASVEFDEKTLQPTYKLLIGLAGASSGIEIARRFGIDQSVIDNARSNLDIAAQEAESYLLKLQAETKRAEDLRIALEEEREATALKYAGLEIEAVKKEKARQKEFEQTLAETVESFERQSKAFIDSIEDKALRNKLDKERAARKAELNRALVSKVQSPRSNVGAVESQAETRAVESVPGENATLEIGSTVITSFGTAGTIEKLDGQTAEVLVGNMRMREKVENLRLAQAETRAVASLQGKQKSISKPIDAPDAAAELNLIGKTTAEAEYELDRFIDEAYMASLPSVRIIHGFGTGALKNYVHHFLKNHELVERFAFAPDNQGGNGATIAELKL
jgi:DNA mismatch repair protein MutS2